MAGRVRLYGVLSQGSAKGLERVARNHAIKQRPHQENRTRAKRGGVRCGIERVQPARQLRRRRVLGGSVRARRVEQAFGAASGEKRSRHVDSLFELGDAQRSDPSHAGTHENGAAWLLVGS